MGGQERAFTDLLAQTEDRIFAKIEMLETQAMCFDERPQVWEPAPPVALATAPKALFITTDVAGGCDGTYVLIPGREANGFPLWKHEKSNNWLFSDITYRWVIGGPEEKAQGFMCKTGLLASWNSHNLRWPHEIAAGSWVRYDLDRQVWVRSPDTAVTGVADTQ